MVQVCHNTVGIFCQNGVGLQTAFNKTLKLSEGTNTYNRQSKRSEFAKLVSIHRYVTQVDIVIVTITCCAINHSLRSIFGEELSIDLSNCQAAIEQMNTAGKASTCAISQVYIRVNCWHQPILALLECTLATLST